jgi:DNA-binding response OmpR family regulator
VAREQKILVVEDDPALNRRLRGVLGARWAVDGALTAADALRRFQEDHFDLLVLDLHLPDRDGLDLLQELEAKGLVTRVVILTAHADLPNAIGALRLHSLDLLRKPVEPRVLVERVEKALAEGPVVAAPLETVLDRARRFLRAGRLDAATAELEAARGRWPESPAVVNLLGVAAELRHELSQASRLYHLAGELGRAYSPARRNAERLVFRSWKGPGAGAGIDFGDDDEDGAGG